MGEEESQAENSQGVNINIGDISQVPGQVNAAGGNITNYQVAEGATLNIYHAAPDSSGKAVNGLNALAELMQSSKNVSMAVVEFRTIFDSTNEQLEILAIYKDLHDQLHDLQFKCYNGLVDDAEYFSTDERAVERIRNYTQDFNDIVRKLKNVTANRILPRKEMENEWVEEANLLCKELSDAVDHEDAAPLKLLVKNINRILTKQPPRINAQLTTTADTLHLPKLLNALQEIFNTVEDMDLDPKKVEIFETGLIALQKLNVMLDLLVKDHHKWQDLEVELRVAGGSIMIDLIDFEDSWGYIKNTKIPPLYGNIEDDWAMELKKESALLDEFLKSKNSAKAGSKFRSYQRSVSRHFYQVDKDLKTLCGELSKVGIPLTTIMEIIS